MFADRVNINLRAGNGGAGVVAFKKEKGRLRGRPIGGSGGGGGSVILEADADMVSLLRYQRNPHHAAGNGTHGEGDRRHGRHGDDLVLPVPLGTLVYDDDGVLLADLVRGGQRVTALEGGRGGKGNAALVSREHKAPHFAEQGEFGADAWFTLELKLIADAALIGYPNAGKSTLISRLSAAKPKIADYPFTTLVPNLGVVAVGEREFVLADIPGLIEGAADGKGLGHEFLRHTERARVLIILLDPSSLQADDVATQYRVLREELAAHSPELTVRPHLVVINKIDLQPGAEDELAASLALDRVLAISAVTGEGLSELAYAILELVDQAARAEPDRQGYVLHRPLGGGFEVTHDGRTWVLTGRSVERAVAFDDLTVGSAADLAASRLERLGVEEALRRAGANPGDDVRIGELVFEFQDDDK